MPRKIDAVTALDEIKRRRAIARQRKSHRSKLSKYRSSIVELRRVGASYREIVFWLRKNHRLNTDHTTVMRYMKSLPEISDDISVSSTDPNRC